MNSEPSRRHMYLFGTEDIGENSPVLYNLHIVEGYDLAGAIRKYSELYNLDDTYESPVLIREVEQWRGEGPLSGFGVRPRPDRTKPEQNESDEEETMKESVVKDDNEPEETKQKKHPLQNSPTFPEEESVEEKQCAIIDDEPAIDTEDKTLMKPDGKFDKPIDPFKTVPIFDVDKFKEGYPYVLKNLENGKIGIVTLHYKSADSLCFNYWDDDGEDAAMSYTVSEFQGAFELYKMNELRGFVIGDKDKRHDELMKLAKENEPILQEE